MCNFCVIFCWEPCKRIVLLLLCKSRLFFVYVYFSRHHITCFRVQEFVQLEATFTKINVCQKIKYTFSEYVLLRPWNLVDQQRKFPPGAQLGKNFLFKKGWALMCKNTVNMQGWALKRALLQGLEGGQCQVYTVEPLKSEPHRISEIAKRLMHMW
eukprot:TRINITY_DN73239_c0_g1_i1.p2 TRINITY_DN73239_c0_g1~~TRINITY_DN73239_c0_g1_i1.p2  ORF type:complete len:172 (+),score=6.48 TRINITY_DN73239_c0_g1_i1:52-516(+)